MIKLFLVYLGGSAPKANIEVHDVQFVASDTIENSYPALREAWFGTQKGLHIDSYMHVHLVDGYRVELRTEKSPNQISPNQILPHQILPGDPKLYFINFGGYEANSISELHQFGLFVASSAAEAKKMAKKKMLKKALLPHKDNVFDIDDCIVLTEVGGHHVHLIPDSGSQPIKPDWFGYEVIG